MRLETFSAAGKSESWTIYLRSQFKYWDVSGVGNVILRLSNSGWFNTVQQTEFSLWKCGKFLMFREKRYPWRKEGPPPLDNSPLSLLLHPNLFMVFRSQLLGAHSLNNVSQVTRSIDFWRPDNFHLLSVKSSSLIYPHCHLSTFSQYSCSSYVLGTQHSTE